MATITTKFSLGEQVWRIHDDTEDIRLPCLDCRGTGSVTAKLAGDREEQVRCPRHTSGNGMATIQLGTWPVWRAIRDPLKIGQIQVRIYDHSGVDNGNRFDNLNPARMRFEDEEGYMAWESGVGSGTVHRADDLFDSLEAAEEEAERRTELARRGESPGPRIKTWAPSIEQVRIAGGFLDHRDVYEHNAAHVVLAEEIVRLGKERR
ncbi:MAG TPA: hypothetical protein VGK43_02680 [Solirubrobacterales bacterium]